MHASPRVAGAPRTAVVIAIRPTLAAVNILRPPRMPALPAGYFVRCWRTLVYMRRLNYSRRLAWIKAG